MIRKPPLRTYSKKNIYQPYVRLYKEPIVGETSTSRLQLESPTADSKENENINNSLNYDPFDTTFDRLLKSSRAQTQPPLTSEVQNISSASSSYATSSDNTDIVFQLPSISNDREDTCNKPHGQDGLRSRHKKKLQNKTHTVKLTKMHHKVDPKKEKKPKNTKEKKRKKGKTSTNSIVSADLTSQDVEVPDNKKHVTDCYIKLTRLSIKEYSSEKKTDAMVSSTPAGKLRKSVMYNISFSPIDGSYIKERKMTRQYSSTYRKTTLSNKKDDSISKSINKDDVSNDKNLPELKNFRDEKSTVLCIPSVLVNSSPSNSFEENVGHLQTSIENVDCVVPTNSNHSVQSNTKLLKDEVFEDSNIELTENEYKNNVTSQENNINDYSNINIHDEETQCKSMSVKHVQSGIDASDSLFDNSRCDPNLHNSQHQIAGTSIHSLNDSPINSLNFNAESNKSSSLFGSSNDHDRFNHEDTSILSLTCNELNGSDAVLHSIKSIDRVNTNDVANKYETKVIVDDMCTASTESLNTASNEKIEHTELLIQDTDRQIQKNTDKDEDADEYSVREANIDTTKEKFIAGENLKNSITEPFPNKILEQCMSVKPYVLITRLEDPVAVTGQRKRHRNWNLQLTNILEDQDETVKLQRSHRSSISSFENNKLNEVSSEKVPNTSLINDSVSEENETSLQIGDRSVSEPTRTLFLKPGKSWARSLSILNNIQSGTNLNKLSIGKGKKWRHSVKDILDMQNQGITQCCVKNQDADKELISNYELLNRQSEPVCTVLTETKAYNPSRFSRRISVRVVPDIRNYKSDGNAAFLVACNTISRESCLESRESLTQYVRQGSVCNVINEVSIVAEANAEKIVLGQCNQENYIPFIDCFPEEYLEYCRKIGEGVYGEVFLYDNEKQKSVIKIIPIEGNELVNGEPQKKFNEILSEIVIAKELHNLRFNDTHNTNGFVEVKNISCIIGKYPERLIELWKNYDEEKNSDNDCPDMFNENQLYIVLELGHGGQDLEAFVFLTAEEAYFSFIQTALALAVAEKSLEFEHRDLHWGNILIARTDKQYILYKFNDKEILLPTKGIQVSIIDFTLSRVSYQGCYIYNDLAQDPALFTAQGEYQFEIYRLMREKTQNNWEKFEPYTNILWLHYTLDKMITAVRYKKKTMKIHKSAILKLKELKDDILSYDSASDFIVNCEKLLDVLYNNASLPSTRSRKVSSNK